MNPGPMGPSATGLQGLQPGNGIGTPGTVGHLS